MEIKGICAIIPGFNVAPTIAEVIRKTSQYISTPHIIVIDDGSRDGTGAIAGHSGCVVLQNEVNRGKGYSLKRGFEFAIQHNFRALITLDGDLQHDPDDIPNFIAAFESTGADIILGDRTHDFSRMPLDRQFSNKMTSLIISILTGQRVRDSQTGYRLIRTEILKHLSLISSRYETESELLVKALRRRYRIAHVPIRTIYNQQPSHIHRLIDTLRFLKIVLHSLIQP